MIAELVEGLNPTSNDHEAMRLRIKSMMSYEGYLEYYEAYSNWQKSQGKTAEKPMSRPFFDSQLASMPKSFRKKSYIKLESGASKFPEVFLI